MMAMQPFSAGECVYCCMQRALLTDRLIGFKIMFASVKSLCVKLVDHTDMFLCLLEPRSFVFIYCLLTNYSSTMLPRTHRNVGFGNVYSVQTILILTSLSSLGGH